MFIIKFGYGRYNIGINYSYRDSYNLGKNPEDKARYGDYWPTIEEMEEVYISSSSLI